MLDQQHPSLPQGLHDDNVYNLGKIGPHNVVIACLPAGQMGNSSAATVASQMRLTFPAIRFGPMVGIGGGAPSSEKQIALGDVVVSRPGKNDGGVIQYDFGRTVAEGRFVRSGTLNDPPAVLLNAVSALQAKHKLSGHELAKSLSVFDSPALKSAYTYQGWENDMLFEASYDHVGSAPACERCDRSRLVPRRVRSTDPTIHYGTIASGNQVMRHGESRERWRKEADVLCFEMEAAGLMNNFPCIVIRGICDYADSHKNKRWQEYAAATAAAYAKELLLVVPGSTANPATCREAKADQGNVVFVDLLTLSVPM
ncbi:hypothetical protein QQS21_010090 [Conoideocrella luteorostrata]|uniref:Nucleoside phosphorylase domain-containing protein n=1 Tax=Conoideocrella luteorostrata TaxID=1105319 RepID=A0AAJ0CGP5_9HYPO|nr:hypothetical protein QQS21_010090 [Conoideocrella luteorostrata]